MAQTAAVLIVAELDDADRARVEQACTRAGLSPTTEPSAEVAVSKLGQKRFDALVVHMGTPGAALACMKARGKLLRIRIPVIALVDVEDDQSFARAYRAGADEVLALGNEHQLVARLTALPKPSIPQPGNARGDAVVADADRTRGEVIERVLKDAGFRVEVVGDGFAARLQAGRPSLKVAVVDASLDDVPALIALARQKGSRCAWVVRARPELLDELRGKLARQDRVAVVSAYGPPDDVLFETNRLLEPRPSDGRADPRLLHGTVVKLKFAGQTLEDVGYTYNVSPLGLYVRTLVPPAGESVELRVTPPGGADFVRLEAKVVWRREFGMTRKEPVPAGFGLQVIGGDIDAWAEACPRVPSLRPPMADEGRSGPPPKPSAAPTARSGEHAIAVPPLGITPPGEVDIQPRDPQPSVEEMLASVLSETVPTEDGAAPLSIDGGTVVELPEDAEAEAKPSELPTVVPAHPPDPMDVAPAPVAEAPASLDAADITPASLGFDDLLESDSETERATITGEELAAREAKAQDAVTKVEAIDAKAEDAAVIGSSDTIPAPSLASAEAAAALGLFKQDPPPKIAEPEPDLSSAAPPRAPSDPPRDSMRVPTARTSPWVFVGAALVIGGVAAVVLRPKASPGDVVPVARPVATVAPAPSPTASLAPDPTALATAPAGSTPAPPESAAAPASAAAEESAAPAESAAPPAPSAPPLAAGAAPGPAPAAPAPAPAPGEATADEAALASLKKGQGFLYVDSPLQTNVYVYGNLAGTTNQRITTNCGPRFLRLGTAPGAWQTEGLVAVVKCNALTRIEMKP
ncbi:MAG TPA: hypothetical protein VHE30_06285 [Polyangiaceae bacterium]|nr:hypothetical protein [Polyangiaceae bacterium]